MMYSEKPTSTGPATQMIFANLGLSGGRGFSVPDYIRAELVRRGVPRDQIANIADYKSHTDKQKLFNDMNEGKVRFLIGSTAKMATGVNAQKRLYAIHNLDPLWYPSDDEQRIGRALRQGNMNPEIEIHDYATNGTYDSSMWKMMGRKAKFIQDFFEGDPNLVEMDDLGEASQYEQASAITTNDPRLIQLTELRQDLEKAQRRQSAFESEVYAIKGRQKEAEKKIQYANDDIVRLEDNIKKRQDITGDKFKATTLGKTYTKRADFADALFKNLQKISTADNKGKKFDVGEIGGFPLNAEVQEYTSFGGGQGTQKTYSPALTMKLSGGDGYFRNIRANTPIGLVQSMESVLKSFEGDIEDKKSDIAKNKKFLKDSKEKSEAKFTGGPEIERLKQEVRDLEASMKTPDTPPPPEADPDLYTMDELNEIGEENDPTESARADGKSLPARTADVVKLAKIIQGIVGDKVKMEFPDIISAGNKSSWGDLSADTWGGVYAPMANLIKVAMADPIFPNKIDTAYHESWHAVEDHFATPMEMALLKKEEPELRRIVQKELDRQKNAVDKISDTEIRAIAFEAYARDRTSGAGLSHGIRRFFERMINILRRVRNSIHGYGFKTSADLFDAAFSGKMKERESRRETGLGSRLADANIDTAYKNNPAMRNSEIEKYRKMAREQVPKRAAGGRVEASNIAEPTPAQAKAGNYSKDHINVHGLNISIENAKGSYRHGVGKDGKAWRSRLPAHYGYIRGTEAKDLDHVDCYIGPYIRSHHVYVIDQLNADTGKYDEAKCFIGFPSRFAALNAFHEAFSDGLAGKRFGHIKEMTMDEFKTWLRDGNTKKPVRYKEAA
jgi:predicted  nucleic acid-binding Zn-ribbon protein